MEVISGLRRWRVRALHGSKLDSIELGRRLDDDVAQPAVPLAITSFQSEDSICSPPPALLRFEARSSNYAQARPSVKPFIQPAVGATLARPNAPSQLRDLRTDLDEQLPESIPDPQNLGPVGGLSTIFAPLHNGTINNESSQRDVSFLCLSDSSGGHYAVRVPCGQQLHADDQNVENDDRTDDDVDTFRRLGEAYFAAKGMWKKWLPCYHVVEVMKVEQGRVTIHKQQPMVVEERRKELERKIDQLDPIGSKAEKSEEEPTYMDEAKLMQVWGYDENEEKEMQRIEEWQDELSMLPRLHAWVDCFRHPHRAEDRGILEGMVNVSPVYEAAEAFMPRSYAELANTPDWCGLYVRFDL
ncbi:hypothetical protein LTR85_000346 [Meristemomyces frigidus]|nr:hypothetical protein LTR85_000346 [Meristemomyces frigidus]